MVVSLGLLLASLAAFETAEADVRRGDPLMVHVDRSGDPAPRAVGQTPAPLVAQAERHRPQVVHVGTARRALWRCDRACAAGTARAVWAIVGVEHRRREVLRM